MAETIRSGGGNVGLQEIDALRQISPRRPGSEAERRAARHLETRLKDLGRDVEVEPTRVRPAFALAHLIHAVAGVIASVLAVYQPGIGLLMAALLTVSAFGDLTGAFQLVRALTPARASQNVVSDEDAGKPGLVVLAAHYDSPPPGVLLEPRLGPIWPRALFYSLALITACALARLVGLDAGWLTVVQFIPTVVLIGLTPLFADIAISDATDDAADNAAGVAAALRLAQTHGNSLEHFDVMLVFTGASAHSGLGMSAWLRRHRKQLDAEATAVISVDTAPGDAPAFATKEGPIFPSRMHRSLVEIASELAEPYTSRDLS